MRKIFLVLSVLALGFVSCKKEMPEPGGTGAEAMANEWWVTLTQGGDDVFGLGHFQIATYNSASSGDSLWIDDIKHSYGFKSKIGADLKSLTFASPAAGSANLYYTSVSPASFPQTVHFTGGKVLLRAGRSRTGNVTDSIYVELEFSDDPGTQYVLSGHARTAFAEDEY